MNRVFSYRKDNISSCVTYDIYPSTNCTTKIDIMT